MDDVAPHKRIMMRLKQPRIETTEEIKPKVEQMEIETASPEKKEKEMTDAAKSLVSILDSDARSVTLFSRLKLIFSW